jgi:hypothetical protein
MAWSLEASNEEEELFACLDDQAFVMEVLGYAQNWFGFLR